jgi:hypothetical protein
MGLIARSPLGRCLHDTRKNKYYPNVMEGWMEAPGAVSGPYLTRRRPNDKKKSEWNSGKATEERRGHRPALSEAGEREGKIRRFMSRSGPAELLVTEGRHSLSSFRGKAQYVKNERQHFSRYPGLPHPRSGAVVPTQSLRASGFGDEKSSGSIRQNPRRVQKQVYWSRCRAMRPLGKLIANSVPQTATITRVKLS